ncbi:transcription factor TGA7 [Ricinus communis]|uniref:Transcription factor TGA7, putative n=1 Tax=Ricinus communis TaxID=3988 RepID=B9RJD3_RICCO|nr:transcription factor TGA7 [Ricinus communis]XP_015571562.1 transcription factor TGA7 [Ricinus communis]XP_048227033.1 transcription factor TGA7 [Ricinus communis]EEF48435.1 Transcription factor TGA7, putative [Ricinus communis]|eukprot:XP_002513852.1 transcription factor TGA7 [Ricinus communis]
MTSSSTQLSALRGMGIYEPFHQISSWGDTFRGDGSLNVGSSTIVPVDTGINDKTEYVSQDSMEHSRSDQESNRPTDKIQRRLAQNREAARKSRLRKKAYVQQLESSRLKLVQLEQELDRARQQGIYISTTAVSGHLGLPGTLNSGITTFEMEYAHWLEEEHKYVSELRTALQAHITDIELRILVENGLNHYNNLFRMKADAAKADVFYLISGKWRTSVERFFQWIGGFRPSELLNVLMSQLEPLTDQQLVDVCNLRQSCQQAEDALSQGIDKLQQTLAQSIAEDIANAGSYRAQMAAAIGNLEALEGFVNQADHLRQQTLQHLSRILTTRQAARGLLALGEYFHRLRALSSLWAARPREPA